MEKIQESLSSVLPITAIVLLLSITIAPLTPGALVLFVFGALLLIVGTGIFTLGVDMSMTPMGSGMGIHMSRSRRKWLTLGAAFVLGLLVTIAEPDLQVLATQVPAIPNLTLILTVAAGVGVFLVLALLRIMLKIPLSRLLVIFYVLAFLLAALAPNDFIPVAFDSGGVTTGPITVPFIMALGVGLASIRSDKNSTSDSFGLVALCSIGPVLSVLALGIGFSPDSAGYTPAALPDIQTTQDAAREFAQAIPHYAREVAVAMVPICLLFIVAAEPAVHVLIKQVEEVSMGAVSQKAMRRGLSIGVAVSVGIAMVRVLTGISILWFLVPGYAFALILTFFVPQMFTGIAFDSGGVASGPMTATFLLPFAMGACGALGGNIMTDAFGLVAMVAMTPLVTIQLLGLAGRVRRRMARSALRSELARAEDTILYYD